MDKRTCDDDPTPHTKFFEQVCYNFTSLASGGPNFINASDRLLVDFETLFTVWASLDKGIEKDKIGKVLNKSPLFEARRGSSSQNTTGFIPTPLSHPWLYTQ